MNKLQMVLDRYVEMAALFAPKIALAILLFVFGLWLTNIFSKVVAKVMLRKKLDVSLQSFLSSLLSVGLKILLLVTVAGVLGIQTSSFVAVIGAAGLAVGLALQGSLSNFAGGVLILLFKPIKVGDVIEVAGQVGEVQEIQIFNTILLTPDNKTVILANAVVSNGIIVNYSRHGNRRVEITMTVSADQDVSKVRALVMKTLQSHPKVLKEPAPTVSINLIADGGISLAIRPFCLPMDYGDVYSDVLEELKKVFEASKISSPVPTRVIISKAGGI